MFSRMVRTALVAPRPAASTSRVFLGRSATATASTRSLHLGWKAAFPSRITSTLEVATANGLQLRVVLRRPFHTAKRVGKYEITLPPVPVKVSALDRVWWVADKALGSGWLVVFGAYYFISDKKNGSWLPNLGNYVYEGVLQYAPSAVVALLEAFEAKNSAHGLDAKFAVSAALLTAVLAAPGVRLGFVSVPMTYIMLMLESKPRCIKSLMSLDYIERIKMVRRDYYVEQIFTKLSAFASYFWKKESVAEKEEESRKQLFLKNTIEGLTASEHKSLACAILNISEEEFTADHLDALMKNEGLYVRRKEKWMTEDGIILTDVDISFPTQFHNGGLDAWTEAAGTLWLKIDFYRTNERTVETISKNPEMQNTVQLLTKLNRVINRDMIEGIGIDLTNPYPYYSDERIMLPKRHLQSTLQHVLAKDDASTDQRQLSKANLKWNVILDLASQLDYQSGMTTALENYHKDAGIKPVEMISCQSFLKATATFHWFATGPLHNRAKLLLFLNKRGLNQRGIKKSNLVFVLGILNEHGAIPEEDRISNGWFASGQPATMDEIATKWMHMQGITTYGGFYDGNVISFVEFCKMMERVNLSKLFDANVINHAETREQEKGGAG